MLPLCSSRRVFSSNPLRFFSLWGIRPTQQQIQKVPEIHKCISGTFYIFRYTRLIAYSNSIAGGVSHLYFIVILSLNSQISSDVLVFILGADKEWNQSRTNI